MGKYSGNLLNRLRHNAAWRNKAGASTSIQKAGEIPPHPRKYPKHVGWKGAVYNGECNRTACTNNEAITFNLHTYGYYCVTCASYINESHPANSPLCVMVDHNLTHEEMNNLSQEY